TPPPQLSRLADGAHRRRQEGDGDWASPVAEAGELEAVGSALDEDQHVRVGVEANLHGVLIRLAARVVVDAAGDEVSAVAGERRGTGTCAGAERRILGAEILERPSSYKVLGALLDVRLDDFRARP